MFSKFVYFGTLLFWLLLCVFGIPVWLLFVTCWSHWTSSRSTWLTLGSQVLGKLLGVNLVLQSESNGDLEVAQGDQLSPTVINMEPHKTHVQRISINYH